MSTLHNPMPLQFEPKRKNRFLLRFPSDIGIQEWSLQTAKRPAYNASTKEIEFLNTKTYVTGKYTWDEIDVSIYDTIGPSGAQAIMEWVRLHSESATGRQGYAASYKRNVELLVLDPAGVVIEKWILFNCFVSKASFGDLNMSEDGILNCNFTLRPDYCILCY